MRQTVIKANKHLGIEEIIFLEYPNLLLETFPLHVINKEIEALIGKYEPTMIFTHHYGDVNRDHQILFQAAINCIPSITRKKAY